MTRFGLGLGFVAGAGVVSMTWGALTLQMNNERAYVDGLEAHETPPPQESVQTEEPSATAAPVETAEPASTEERGGLGGAFFTTESQRSRRSHGDFLCPRLPESENKKSSVILCDLRVSVVKKSPEIAHAFKRGTVSVRPSTSPSASAVCSIAKPSR